MYEGDVAGLATSGTLTGEFLHRPITLRSTTMRKLVESTYLSLDGKIGGEGFWAAQMQ